MGAKGCRGTPPAAAAAAKGENGAAAEAATAADASSLSIFLADQTGTGADRTGRGLLYMQEEVPDCVVVVVVVTALIPFPGDGRA